MRVLSKLKKPKATRILGGALGLLLALTLVLMPVPVLAVQGIPHWFHGTVTIDGELAPEGTIVSAQIGGVQYGDPTKGESYGTVDADSRYGDDPLFYVPADNPDTSEVKEGGVAGDTVEFYITNLAMGLDGVKANETALFENFGVTELNLTVGEVDTTPPTVVSTVPLDADTNMPIDVVVSATFDEAIDEATLVFTLDSVAGSVAGMPIYDSSTKTASFTPDANLDYALTYTASVEASDLAGNAMAAAHTWSFTTTPPPLPHAFYGSLTINGSLAPIGTEVEAGGEGVTTDIVGNPIITTEVGRYGSSDPLGEKLVVQGDIETGATIYFYITNAELGLDEVQANETYAFSSGALTELPLTVEVAPISFTTTLLEDWNLLSTPILLDVASDSMEQIFDAQSLINIQMYYSWDAVSAKWDQVLADYQLLPLYAIYVKVISGASATAEFIPSGELSEPPSRELQQGLNLIGAAPALEAGVFPDTPLDEALVSIEVAGEFWGYCMVVSPDHNQPDWAYALGSEIKDLLSYKGYWVVMDNADTMYGFSTTPISP